MTLTHDEQVKRQKLVDAMRDMIQAMEVFRDTRTLDGYVGTVPIEVFEQYERQLVTLRQAVLDVTSMSQINDPYNPIWAYARDTYFWCFQFIRNGGRIDNTRPGQRATYGNWSTANEPIQVNLEALREALRKAGLL